MDLGLAGRTVLVSGAASGIGRACALAFAREGARLALLDIDDDAGAALQRELAGVPGAGASRFFRADVSDEATVSGAVRDAAAAFGGIDAVVGCAGISGPVGLGVEDVALSDFRRVMEVNVTGQFLLAKHCAPFLRVAAGSSPGAGAMVLLASDSSFVAAPGMVPYNASKGAVLQLTRALSVELAADGVRVNCVCPSVVDTPMARTDLGETSESLNARDFPVQSPEQVANHVLYLASPASAPVNGTSLVSDFGYLARSSFPA
ncbi:dehydrogenase [Arthrobacter sp. SW1]|uniref:SDR family NAD(P)-dependent oxidoreductase n=1 Tax=Arthrobacter sp. SW1 TaxID=1920889 RepID=UPI000877BAC1|nr:SDR family oxidoreductase [Arthrobacter sp. SW1]OFI37024.1 dehydrogenase [Arthrobacter sp. SW1]